MTTPTTYSNGNGSSLLIRDICLALNITAFKYISYSTGSYDSKKSQGITLQFNNLQINEDAYIVYNASLKRTRNSSGGKKGEHYLTSNLL